MKESDKRTSVTVLIPLFAFSLTTHFVHSPTVLSRLTNRNNELAVAASAESFDNCHPSSPHYGPGANNLSEPPNSKLRLF